MGFAGTHRHHPIRIKWMYRERQEPGLFFLENPLDGSGIVSRPGAAMGNVIPPLARLAVEILKCGKWPCREERSPHELDRAFHAAFFVAAANLTRTNEEMVMGAKLEQPRMELYGVSATFQDRRTQVVAQNRSRHTTPILEGMNVAAQEVFQRLVEEKLEKQSTRVREGQHET